MIAKVKNFTTEAISELKKVTWTSRKDLIESTWLVLISSICLGLFIAGTDFVLSKFVTLIIK